MNLHAIKIRQIVLILSKAIILKDQIVSENRLRPTETLLIWFLACYYLKLRTPGLDRERCSTLNSKCDVYKMCAKYMYVTFFLYLVNAKRATYGDTSTPLIELFFLGLMTNPCAPSFTQDIKPSGTLLSLFGVPPKNPLTPLQAFVISVQ